MTATIAVNVDTLTTIARLSIRITTTTFKQKVIHENHTYTDLPNFSFDLANSTKEIDELSRMICIMIGEVIGNEELKKCFDMEKEILKEEFGIGEDDDA